MAGEWVGTGRVCQELDITRRTAQGLIDGGQFTTRRITPGGWRVVPLHEVIEYRQQITRPARPTDGGSGQ
jgi:hypothetical protein